MRNQQPIVFGKSPWDTEPQRWSFLGAQGWWRVPLAWFTRREESGCITASPNADFTPPLYDVLINNDGYMVFQSCGLNTKAGLMSPAQH